jgi:sugar phosphate permease
VKVVVNGKDVAYADAKAGNPAITAAVAAAGYPKAGDAGIVKMSNPFDIFRPQVAAIIGLLFILVIFVTMVYGPIAAMLVELFPTKIRYTSMSLPYHIGNGWFGGFLPTTAFAIVAATGNVYAGLWYPIGIAALTLIVGLLFLLISMVGAIIGGVVFGFISDRWGRKRSMILALICAIAVVPLWAFAPSLALLVLGAFLLQFMVQGAWGIVPAHLSELSPDSVRGFLPGFAYQCGVLLAGSVAYIEALFAERVSYAAAMSLTAVTVFAGAIVAVAAGREKRGIKFGEVEISE